MTGATSSISNRSPPAEVVVTQPRATYRVQLHAGFTFDDAAGIVDYLARLGISHLYCSPVLQAAPGSTHGYDIVDHGRLSDELGGASGYARLCGELAAHDMSMVIDIVPNHMALAGAANRWWWDVLEDGPASRYARYFDIDWAPTGPGDGPSVLMPVLGDHYGRVLEAGELVLTRSGGSLTVRYHDHELPLSPRSVRDLLRAAGDRAGSPELGAIAAAVEGLPPAEAVDAIEERHAGKEVLRQQLRALAGSSATVADAVDAELAAVQADPEALDALLRRQSYRLAHWRTASEQLDYRRFFDITTLVGLRAEDPLVFADTHRLLAELVAAGDVTGLRVDHVDGLRDPAGYLGRLRDAAPGAFVAVEKILAADEELPPWPVVGTSGYDFLDRVGELFVDPTGVVPMTAAYEELVGDDRSFADVAHDAKQHVMREELAAETERLSALLDRICASRRRHRDHTRRNLRLALQEVAGSLGVYRTYVVAGEPTSTVDRERVAGAIARARGRRPDLDAELLDLIERILLLDEPGELEAELAVRFQQLTAPVTAKGAEDTAFYRYGRLLARNEVGGDPGSFGRGVQPFHEHNATIARRWPSTMLTVSTHDTKRSADVRARISLLSELPDAWADAVRSWIDHNAVHKCEGWPDTRVELVLYQTLVGAWPISPARVEAAMVKSANEAKVHTSWSHPDVAYAAALRTFIAAVLDDAGFVALLEGFLAEHDLVALGRSTSLAQTALLLTSPGVPDIYQGDEVWDLSLVDPDNRRPVNFDTRTALLDKVVIDGQEEAMARSEDGGPKLWLIHRLLQHRHRHPELYQEVAYAPLVGDGPEADRIVAFARDGLLVVVPRLLVGLRKGWQSTTLELPNGTWTNVLTDEAGLAGRVEVEALLARVPVAVLQRDGGD